LPLTFAAVDRLTEEAPLRASVASSCQQTHGAPHTLAWQTGTVAQTDAAATSGDGASLLPRSRSILTVSAFDAGTLSPEATEIGNESEL
jgi:hypothetical protein